MGKYVKFNTTPEEHHQIQNIVRRAYELELKHHSQELSAEELLELEMDITATHCNGCPLDFEKLLNFDDFSFMHDVAGIHRRIDRETGTLTNCFLPRCRVPGQSSKSTQKRLRAQRGGKV